MRILVHDYSGHPFQIQLSRALARRSHEVVHVHCSSYQTGKGALHRREGDPETLRIEAIDLGAPFDRYSLGHRLRQELAYGKLFASRAEAVRPDVILSSNDPLFAKARAALWCRRTSTPWIFWLQDVYSSAMAHYVAARLKVAGPGLGAVFRGIERRLLREARAVVAISDDFSPLLRAWGVEPSRCHVIENWAPLDELHPGPRDNAWSRAHGLEGCRVLLYSGTLGLKHDPRLLLALAEHFRGERDVRVVVISEGRGEEWLRRQAAMLRLDNLMLFPFQPYDVLSQVMASADVLVALLERDAGVFSVPSKVLSYLCAGRPVLAAIPGANLAARTIERAGAGIVTDPGDQSGFLRGARDLLDDEVARRELGERARRHAERAFDIDSIASRFEAILCDAAGGSRMRSEETTPN